MTIAKHIKTTLSGSSWIRKMFEEGTRLKAEHGVENVFDFSLGNPNLKPPEKFQTALDNAVMASSEQGHGYMPNMGHPACSQVCGGFSMRRGGGSGFGK